MPNIYFFKPLKCEYLLDFLAFYNSKLNIFGYIFGSWTNKTFEDVTLDLDGHVSQFSDIFFADQTKQID